MTLYLSVITLGELQKGVSRLPEGKKRANLQTWLDHELTARFEGRIVPFSQSAALLWGELTGAAERDGQKLPVVDSLLAAVALDRGLTLVTRNSADFKRTRVPLFDP
jgi:predicted nucleic acid-binding protein